MTLAQVTVSGNSALIGGGIITEGAMALTHVTVSNNSADDGGGVYNLKNMTLAHVTFSGNSANNGSAITHSDSVGTGVLTLKNVILNQGAAGTNCFVANGSLTKITSAGFNLSSDGSCLFDQAGDRNSVNPMLGPLTNNGGFTHTHMLLDGSPAIDAGQCVNDLATDQRGLPRLQGAACDIGAVERQPEDGQQGFAIYLPVLVK